MLNDLQIIFRGTDFSDAVELAVKKRVEKLERYCDQILGCRVVLDAPHNNHHKGKVYHVGIEVYIPNKDVTVNHEQHDKHAHEDLYVAIRDAFNVVERQLKAVFEKQRKLQRNLVWPSNDTMNTDSEVA